MVPVCGESVWMERDDMNHPVEYVVLIRLSYDMMNTISDQLGKLLVDSSSSSRHQS